MRAAALGLGLLLSAQPEPQKLPEPRTLSGGLRVLARQSTKAKRPGRCVTSVVWPAKAFRAVFQD